MLIHETIKAEIEAAFTEVMNQEEGREQALSTVADKIATAVENAIKSMTITYTTGLVTSMGPVTGVFQYTIS